MERPIAYMGEQPYIFVSYSHRDSERVWPIILKLQADGYRIWYDDGISPGTEWDVNIAVHIRKCSFFLAFISANYLGSNNCKDELSFVRELNKNRVLIYLEDVILPDEMQMRLGRLQAIYWEREGEKKAYKKLMRSPGLDACREPAVAPAPSEPEPEKAAVPSTSETVTIPPVTKAPEPHPTAETAPPVTKSPSEKTAIPAKKSEDTVHLPDSKMPAKKSPLPFIGIGAALLVVLVLIVRSMGSSQTSGGSSSQGEAKKEVAVQENQSPGNTAKEEAPKGEVPKDAVSQENASKEEASKEEISQEGISGVGATGEYASAEEPSEVPDPITGALSAYSNGVVSSNGGALFAGILTDFAVSSYTYDEQQELDYKGDTYIVSRLPFITISSFDDQNSIILGFYDKFGADFYFYGTYTVDGENLTISPGGSAGSFVRDCAPLVQDLTYKIEMTSDTIKLFNTKTYVKLCGYQGKTGAMTLRGALSEGSQSFKGLQSLDIVFDAETGEVQKGILAFEDGKTANIDSCTYYSNIHSINLRWSSVEYILNGREVSEGTSGNISFYFIDQSPAGFMITSEAENGVIYYYQDLSGF